MADADGFDLTVRNMLEVSKLLDAGQKVVFVCMDGKDGSVALAKAMLQHRGLSAGDAINDKLTLTMCCA